MADRGPRATSLETLSQLLDAFSRPRATRLLTLLADFADGHAAGWAFCVPRSFSRALDISKTVRRSNGRSTEIWTQGARFTFSPGDTFYDSADAYDSWERAVRGIRLCIEVVAVTDVAPATKERPRSPGKVVFRALTPDCERQDLADRGQHEMTQDEFVRFLIEGSPGIGGSREEAQ